jgi:hypothetical protein
MYELKLKLSHYKTTNGWVELRQDISDWCLDNLHDYWGIEHHVKHVVLIATEQPVDIFIPENDRDCIDKTIKNFVRHVDGQRFMQHALVASWATIYFLSEDDAAKFKLFWK